MPDCSIDGCDKSALARGWCSKHYYRWKRCGTVDGDAGRAEYGSVQAFISDVALDFDADECLPWPFQISTTGYGRLAVGGKKKIASRYVCELANGEAPTAKHEAAHNCGNKVCVNPKHLRWATRQENEDDKLIHGIKRGRPARSYTANPL
jgi:hypothetical protein